MYDLIQELKDDHQKILSFLNEFENKLLQLMLEQTFHKQDYIEVISFIQEFADKVHHQREEQILFRYMIEFGGKVAENLVRQGMLVEHDYARFYVKELSDAVHRYDQAHEAIDQLSILSYGKSYCDLLRRHIDKEDNVVYPFAQRILSSEQFIKMNEESVRFSQSN